MKNYICYINGVSSCGKTSIAKEMLNIIDEKTIYLSLDNIHENLCKNFSTDEWKLYEEEVYGLHRMAKLWYEMGFNVIVDCVLAKKVLWEDALKVIPISYFVGIYAPLEVLLEREKQRGRHEYDIVKLQYNVTHQYVNKYSLKLDSSKSTSKDMASFIVHNLNKKYKEKIKIKPKVKVIKK